MAVDRRTLWLGLAVIVVLIVAAVVWTSGRAAAPAASPARSTAKPSVRDAEAERPPGHVNLEALQADRGEPVDLGRNPFQFRPAAPPPPSLPPGTPARPTNQGSVTPGPPPPPSGPPPPPPIPLKFIGVVTQGGKRVAVLTDGRSPQGGTEGDIILGQYKILKIGNESIEMSYVDGRGRQTIRLTGQ